MSILNKKNFTDLNLIQQTGEKKKGNKKKKIKFQSSSKSVANYKITLSYTK
jgi:hypothetical protein